MPSQEPFLAKPPESAWCFLKFLHRVKELDERFLKYERLLRCGSFLKRTEKREQDGRDDDTAEAPQASIASFHVRPSNILSVKLLFMGTILFLLLPCTEAVCSPSKGFRMAAGVTSTATAMALIPLHTPEGVPKLAWIGTFVAWVLCFFTYICLQLLHIPHRARDKRNIYIFAVAMASLHFTMAASQGSDSTVGGFILFGPIASTASAYLMSLFVSINWRDGSPGIYEMG
ncbi:hypothetical protein FZEAL_4210 [Fusarium zealandicum]|uniref:Uncharacterized protein n=1 Tax=Fusarium zealandicum TaxID=1053134 RepID=A0A8H4UME8_9HYPO|nr:hypothetical protein FZEAL_4210 [Fusarium zealandicum]